MPRLPTVSSRAGIRQLPSQGAQVEHHPGSQADLQRPLPSYREGGADPAVRRLGGSVLQGPPGGTDGAREWRAGSSRQLPPRHRLAGAQARGLRPLPLPGAAVSHQALPARLRRAAGMARGTCRRGVRAHSAPGGDHHGSHGGQRAVVAAGGGPALRLRRGAGPGRAQTTGSPGADLVRPAGPQSLRPPVTVSLAAAGVCA